MSTSGTQVESYQGILQRYKVPKGPDLPMFLNGDLDSDKAVSDTDIYPTCSETRGYEADV
jgi:hypothetical protein